MAIHALFLGALTALSGGEIEYPTSAGLEHMAKRLRGDVRLIAMGDSYCGPYFTRVPLAALRVWPIPNIMGIGGGAAAGGNIIRCATHCAPVAEVWANNSSGYRVERQSTLTYFTLPIRELREIYTDFTFDDLGSDTLFEFKFNELGEDGFGSGVHGAFIEPSDTLAFRFLYRCPTDIEMQLDEIKISDYDEESGIIQLKDGARPFWHLGEQPGKNGRAPVARQINASAFDYPANNDLSLRRVNLSQTSPLTGTNRYFEPAGGIYYHVDEKGSRETGLYYSHISDNSWSYIGFGSDIEGSWYLDKNFSQEQFTHWLDVTTLDRDQPTVFFWFFAPEPMGYNIAYERMTNMIAQAEASSADVGLTNVEHLIVIAPLFKLNDDIELSKTYIRHQQQVAFDLANKVSNISAASLFNATDEIMFNGTEGVPWLLYHGFDQFEFGSNAFNLIEDTGGDMFDISVVHPGSANAAAFFASLLGEIIREAGCKADVVADGYIDTNDILAVIGRIGNEHVEEDINEDGIVDVQDILLVIDGWGDCWPVQAPYNTSTFRNQ